jgi:hypothetical protein
MGLITKAIKAGYSAYKKTKADDILAAAKAAKDKAEKAKQAAEAAKKTKDLYNAGKKAGAKSFKRKATAVAATVGAAYLEGKTGVISAGAKKAYNKAKEVSKTSSTKTSNKSIGKPNAKPLVLKGSPKLRP